VGASHEHDEPWDFQFAPFVLEPNPGMPQGMASSNKSRWELTGLDQRSLQDIGLSGGSADYEASKPFWMA
jgi:hypothetical protein